MCQAEDDSDASRFVLTDDGILAKVSDEASSSGDILWMSLIDGLCENPGGKWFLLSYVEAGGALSLVCLSRNGAIVTVQPTTGEAELVGEFEHGLQAAAFSPDGEVLCLLTFSGVGGEGDSNAKNSALLLMNTQWEVLAETCLESHILSDRTPDSKVSICWRPDGSLVALSTVDVADNMRKVRIFKRDNLQLHAIGRTEDGSGKFVLNMIASAGISWAGAGCSQLLAAAQRKGKKTIQVIFFEPNGNRHREFMLRENSNIDVSGLAWNVESDLLAVHLRDSRGNCDKVQLWHRSNYHWYMKHEFRFTAQLVSHVAFHDGKPGCLFIFFLNTTEWREYEVIWQPSQIQTFASKTCAAYVVDGASLNMTALDQAMMPPPMYASTLTMECPIIQVLLSNDESKLVTAIVRLSDASVALLGNPLKEVGNRTCFTTPSIVAKGKVQPADEFFYSRLRSCTIFEHTDSYMRLLAAFSAPKNGFNESLVVLTITWNEQEGTLHISRRKEVLSLNQRALCIAQWSDSMDGAVVGAEDGKVYDVEVAEDGAAVLHALDSQEFMEPCLWIGGLKQLSSLGPGQTGTGHYRGDAEHDRLVFGLSKRSRLFCHDMLLADAVSSFLVSVSHQYLCYTTAQGSTSQLRFLPLKDLQTFDTLMGSDGNILLEGYEPRSVERGSRLVAVLPGNPKAVLQVPRGNLEGIYPRALVLQFVMKEIAAGDFGDAFTTMRQQKVNLNLIVDLNPKQFLESGLQHFFKQVPVIDHLNFFISSLQNWDSTKVQYRVPHWLTLVSEQDVEAKTKFDFSSKVNQVCTKLRSLMLQAEADGFLEEGRVVSDGDFLLPILTTFAKQDPPKLEEALTVIKENAISRSKQSIGAAKKPAMFSDAAQSSIQYLAFLADHELIFNVGLGLYDFDIARACARNSQMDPKVYLPLLKRLRGLPTYYGRYVVDMRLKRFEKALRNLFESGRRNEPLEGIEPVQFVKDSETTPCGGNEFEHCLSLVRNYSLHGVGLELYGNDTSKKRLIMQSLGENLLKENKAGGALTVFLAMDPVDVEQAKRAARACKNWKCYFTLSCLSESADHETEKKLREAAAKELSEGLALSSANQYSRQSDFSDAARMLLDYCNDVDGAVDMLIKGWLWQEGCRVATLTGRLDLVQKCIDAAVSFALTIQADLDERRSDFEVTNETYEKVLELRKKVIGGGEDMYDQFVEEETGSLFSAASNASNMSLQSTASTGSLASVISIKSANSFSISGSEVETRHKSKFNKLGGKKKKKKKGNKNRIQPGSPENLKSALEGLRGNCVEDDLSNVISQTLEFLCQTGKEFELARGVFKSYTDLSDTIQQSHVERAEARKAGQSNEQHGIPVKLPVEEEVSKLACPRLSEPLYDVFVLL